MSTIASTATVDDLVDMFSRYPRSTIEDLVQRGGAAQAFETLLSFGDDSVVRMFSCRPAARPPPPPPPLFPAWVVLTILHVRW